MDRNYLVSGNSDIDYEICRHLDYRAFISLMMANKRYYQYRNDPRFVSLLKEKYEREVKDYLFELLTNYSRHLGMDKAIYEMTKSQNTYVYNNVKDNDINRLIENRSMLTLSYGIGREINHDLSYLYYSELIGQERVDAFISDMIEILRLHGVEYIRGSRFIDLDLGKAFDGLVNRSPEPEIPKDILDYFGVL